eukprot:3835180-Prymnesium_polylepis.1
MEAMTAFLSAPGYEFSGICNFNYKLRQDGSMCIFEINTRVGAGKPCAAPLASAIAHSSRAPRLQTVEAPTDLDLATSAAPLPIHARPRPPHTCACRRLPSPPQHRPADANLARAADFACDIPRNRARAVLEKLDTMFA